MAGGKINATPLNAPITGTFDTTVATTARTEYMNQIIRIGNIVLFRLAIGFTNSIGSGDFAQIPRGYRPKANVTVPMTVRNTDGSVVPLIATIKADGLVSQSVMSVNVKFIQLTGFYLI